MYAIFNDQKEFLSYGDQPLGGSFLSILIPDDKTNLTEWRWDGDYDTGGMVRLESTPYEEVMNQDSFQNKYPLPLYMSLILKQLYVISKKENLLSENYAEMVKQFIICFEGNDEFLHFLKQVNKI